MTSSSPTPDEPSELEPWAEELARQTVRIDRATRGAIPGHEDIDLAQEVLLHWVTKRHTYRADRGASPKTYFRRLAEHRLTDLRRRARAAQRGGGMVPMSLDIAVSDDGDRLADLLADPGSEPPETFAEHQAAAGAVARLRQRLGERDQELLALLAMELDRSEIARRLGVNRSTIYRSLERIRAIAEDEGLRSWLE